MKNIQTRLSGFTLVELLVTITILSIISVVAYQNFGGAVDKALSGRKVSDVSTIETSLQQYKVDNSVYPAVDLWDADSNKWGYNPALPASLSNTIDITANGSEIASIDNALGGWTVRYIDNTRQIGAKWVISDNTLGKAYLSKDLYDPEVWDLSANDADLLIDQWIGRYIYAVYRKPTWDEWGATNNKTGTYYNIAYTVKKDGSDTYITKIVGDYDADSCFDSSANCPDTLIGPGTSSLIEWQEQGLGSDGVTSLPNFWSSSDNQGIPYPVSDFE